METVIDILTSPVFWSIVGIVLSYTGISARGKNQVLKYGPLIVAAIEQEIEANKPGLIRKSEIKKSMAVKKLIEKAHPIVRTKSMEAHVSDVVEASVLRLNQKKTEQLG